jgi:HEAT repeat protein
VDPLIEALQKTEGSLVIGSISDALGRIGDPRAVDPLIEALQKTEGSYVIGSISDALGRIGDPRAVDPLIEALQKTENPDVIGSISDALGRIGDPRAVDPLITVLQKIENVYVIRNYWRNLQNFNPIHFYTYLENESLKQNILHIFCYFSTTYNLRFFPDKIISPEGEILYLTHEEQKEKTINKLNKIMQL